jgi:hypothetical protein
MRLLLNIIWFVLAGLWIAIGYTLAALICFILIVTIPFGVASLRIAIFALWPFGKTVVKRVDAGVASGIGNILWFLLCGWWLAIAHLLSRAAVPDHRRDPTRAGELQAHPNLAAAHGTRDRQRRSGLRPRRQADVRAARQVAALNAAQRRAARAHDHVPVRRGGLLYVLCVLVVIAG